MKRLIALIAVVHICIISAAQNSSIKGVITDTANKRNLENTVISLLRSKDSVLYKFTRSKADGFFLLNSLDTGNYELFIHHKAYASYTDHLLLSDDKTIDLGKIMLSLKANLLKDVVVRSQIAAIRMKGDTTEYTADSFKVRPGASVEDLLRQMPGFTIDKDGKITAQGTNIEKVLVDGEEFFGDDPTIATKNLPADAIDKVQVFDKKSDQAAFTGIDDGQSKKTINLKMKEDKKKGYFGKIEAGSSVNDRWNNSVMFNRFRAKQKFSAYGIMSSTGSIGLGWQDKNSYGGGDDTYYDDFGGAATGDNDFDGWNSSYSGQGLPKSWAGGANYSNKFNADKENVNASYRYNKLDIENESKSLSRAILNKGALVTNSSATSYSSKFRHAGNGMYEWNIDSSTSLKLYANGQTGKINTVNNNLSELRNQLDTLINRTKGSSSQIGESQKLNATMLLRKKFKKAGRTFSLDLDERYSKSTSTGYLFANITTFDENRLPIDSITDQQKLNDAKTSVINAKAVYTEPFSKKVFMEVSYAIRNSRNNSERFSFDKNADGKYADTNFIYSNSYRFNVLTNTAGLAFSYNDKKITASAGSDVAFQHFNQDDLINDSTISRHYTNLFPRMNFRYKTNNTSGFFLNYNGRTRQPSITQIQPIRDNTNPLVVYDGNPLLKQEFNHNVSLGYNTFKVLGQKYFYLEGQYSQTNNAIVTSQYTNDTTGKTIYRYINSNGNSNSSLNVGYSRTLKKLDLRVRMSLDANFSKISNFINDVKNDTRNNAYGIRWGAGKYVDKKYSFYYYAGITFNISKSSVNSTINNNYWVQNHGLYFNIQLPKKFEFNTDIDYNIREKTALFTSNNNVFLWNAYIGKKILKNDKGLIKFSAFDILNQNKGFFRTQNNNVLLQQNYLTINRYFMLQFVWNFTKTPGGAPVAP